MVNKKRILRFTIRTSEKTSNGVVRSDVHLSARENNEVAKFRTDNHSKSSSDYVQFPCMKNRSPSGQKENKKQTAFCHRMYYGFLAEKSLSLRKFKQTF